MAHRNGPLHDWVIERREIRNEDVAALLAQRGT